MSDTPASLLRELVNLLGDRPYQALTQNGPYACVFCDALTLHEHEPHHTNDCPWPRVLTLTRGLRGVGKRTQPANEG